MSAKTAEAAANFSPFELVKVKTPFVSDLSGNAEPPTGGPAPAAGAAGDEDFDMFAQSRQSFDQHKEAMGYVDLTPLLSQ